MIDHNDELFKDLEAVRQIPIVPTMLEVICQTTGMGFAAVARVTKDRWLACRVRDEMELGLKEGGELKIEKTLCQEVRDFRKPIVMDHADEDPEFKHHRTLKIYGFQSYISIPIILKNGTVFGTLCALDSKPAKVNNTKTIGMFTMFAELLSFHLQSLDLLERSHKASLQLQDKNRILTQVNFDLDNFVYTASHDLKSPLSNIEGLISLLSDTVAQENIDRAEIHQILGLMKSSVQRFAVTIKDLTSIVEADRDKMDEISEEIDIFEMVENVKQDLAHLIAASKAKIEVRSENEVQVSFSKKNFKSILYNLLSNALKYRSPDRLPEVIVHLNKVEEKIHLSVTDNGLGIPHEEQDKLFTMFKRFHDHVEGSGLGLYIVKRITDNIKGQIQVKSTVNQGTTFTLIF